MMRNKKITLLGIILFISIILASIFASVLLFNLLKSEISLKTALSDIKMQIDKEEENIAVFSDYLKQKDCLNNNSIKSKETIEETCYDCYIKNG